MIEETAIVTAIHGEQITVKSEVKSTCSGCQQVDTCGSGQISKAFPHKTLFLEIPSALPLKLGDKVVIGLSEKVLLSTAWQVYGFPLLGMLVFALIGQQLSPSLNITGEWLQVLLAAVGGYLGYKLACRLVNKKSKAAAMAPTILRKLQKSDNNFT